MGGWSGWRSGALPSVYAPTNDCRLPRRKRGHCSFLCCLVWVLWLWFHFVLFLLFFDWTYEHASSTLDNDCWVIQYIIFFSVACLLNCFRRMYKLTAQLQRTESLRASKSKTISWVSEQGYTYSVAAKLQFIQIMIITIAPSPPSSSPRSYPYRHHRRFPRGPGVGASGACHTALQSLCTADTHRGCGFSRMLECMLLQCNGMRARRLDQVGGLVNSVHSGCVVDWFYGLFQPQTFTERWGGGIINNKAILHFICLGFPRIYPRNSVLKTTKPITDCWSASERCL